MSEALRIYSVYKTDDGYLLCMTIVLHGVSTPPNKLFYTDQYDHILEEMEGRALVKMMPMEGDDPKLIETWV